MAKNIILSMDAVSDSFVFIMNIIKIRYKGSELLLIKQK